MNGVHKEYKYIAYEWYDGDKNKNPRISENFFAKNQRTLITVSIS